jgi:hypothetical protein
VSREIGCGCGPAEGGKIKATLSRERWNGKMEYQILTSNALYVVTVLPDERGDGVRAKMRGVAPTVCGDDPYVGFDDPVRVKAKTKDRAVEFYKKRVRLGGAILKAGWVPA